MSRRHFGPQHLSNIYAGMGNARHRPYYPSIATKSVADSIAEARRQAAAEARRRTEKK